MCWGPAWIPWFSLDARERRRRHRPADCQGGLEHERVVVGRQGDRQDAGGVDLGGELEQGRLHAR